MARISIGKKGEPKPGSMKSVSAGGGDDIVVANVNGNLYAMKGTCNHQGGPLAEGELDNNIITCPWHGAKWDVTTVKLVEFPMELDNEPTYKIVTEGDELFVET